MLLVGITLLCAIAVGYARGGRLGNLGNVRLYALWLVVAAAVAQAAVTLGAAAGARLLRSALLATSYVAVLAFVWLNRALPGMRTIFVGFALNAVVITANGGMPVSPAALRAVGAPSEDITPGKHRLLGEDDPLPWLADVIPVPPLPVIISIGDVVLAAGVAVLVVGLMSAQAVE